MTIDQVFREVASKGCMAPGCNCKTGPIVLNARCHPGAGLRVEVNASKGTLTCLCDVCSTPVLTINHTMSN